MKKNKFKSILAFLVGAVITAIIILALETFEISPIYSFTAGVFYMAIRIVIGLEDNL